MNYINMKGNCGIETIEDLKGLPVKEKRRLLNEYRISDRYNQYYFSSRCTKDYK